MGPILYRLRAGVRARRTGTLGIIALVTVVGALVLTLAAGALRTLSAAERYEDAQDVRFDLAVEQFAGPPLVDELAELPSVRQIEMASFVFGGLLVEGGEQPVDTFVFAGDPLATGLNVVEGRAPDADSPGEFVATRSFVDAVGAALGDRFTLITISREQAERSGFDVDEPAGPTVDATLVGVLEGPGELQDGFPLTLFPASLLDEGDVGIASSVGLIALTPGATLDDLRGEVDELPDGSGIGLEPAEVVPAEVRSAVRTQGQGLGVVALIVAVASVAVVGQLLSRQLRLAPSQRLALSALGFSRRDLLADQLARAALPVLAGSLLASVVAVSLSGTFPVGFAERVEPDPGLLFDPLAHLVGTAVLAVLVITWLVVALRGVNADAGGPARAPGLIDRLVPFLRPPSAAAGVRFAFARHPTSGTSMLAPVVGLVVVLAVLVGALTFGSGVERLVEQPRRWGLNFDAGFGVGGDVVEDDVLTTLAEDPDVDAVTLYGTSLGGVGSYALDVTGMQPVSGFLAPEVVAGRLPADEEEILLGRVTARDLHVGVGDELTVTGEDGPQVFVVSGFGLIPGVDGGDGMGEGSIVTLEGIHRLEPGASLGNGAIRFRPGAPDDTAARLTEATGVDIGQFDAPAAVVSLDRVRSSPFLVAGALALLAVLSVGHQLLVSAHRRRRDVAVLRALGADRRWVRRALHWQASAFVLVVLVLAIPLGIAAGRVVFGALADNLGAPSDAGMPFAIIAAAFVGLLVLGNVVAVLPARRVGRQLPAEALAEE